MNLVSKYKNFGAFISKFWKPVEMGQKIVSFNVGIIFRIK